MALPSYVKLIWRYGLSKPASPASLDNIIKRIMYTY